MSENKNSGFSVLDMADSYAAANDIDVADIFKKNPVSGNIKAEAEKVNESKSAEDTTETSKSKKKEWMPDASLLEGMNEFSGPVTYHKDEIKVSNETELKNISDDNALKDSVETKSELDRKHVNIEAAKKRHGIKHFIIPEGQYHASIFAAAGDTNYKRAQEKLDVIFNEIKDLHPEFVLEWEKKELEPASSTSDISKSTVDIIDNKDNIKDNIKDNNIVNDNLDLQPSTEIDILSEDDTSDVKVVLNKSQLPEVSWTPEELDKIKKSRTIELNIIETLPLEFSEIQDVDSNMVDTVLAPYQRKYNDVSIALPASRYRATVTGLTFAELTDLQTSVEMNSLDAERKKWSICFNHIRNQNIGPWEEYKWYIDPNSKKKIRVGINENVPNNISPSDIHVVTKFDDFLMKTSYIDLDFIIWKILCATATESEIITINCHAKLPNGNSCNKSYDWLYNPADLLRVDLIDPAVLEEMKVTGEANTKEDILSNYNASPLRCNNTVKLRSSGMSVVFGHISAYDYLNDIFGLAEQLTAMIEAEDPGSISKGYNILMLKSIKSIIITTGEGKHMRIKGGQNLLKVFEKLDEVDWQTLFELSNMMTTPYDFKYSFQNLVCPNCHTKSSIDIENISRLLFVVSQSVTSVQIKLKRT